jgi:hypothetical protein
MRNSALIRVGITSERSVKNKKDEKYIADRWYEYLKQHEPRLGDLLLFEIQR